MSVRRYRGGLRSGALAISEDFSIMAGAVMRGGAFVLVYLLWVLPLIGSESCWA